MADTPHFTWSGIFKPATCNQSPMAPAKRAISIRYCIVKGESSLECAIFNFRPSVRAIALGHCHAEPRRTEKPRVAAATTRTNEIVAGTCRGLAF